MNSTERLLQAAQANNLQKMTTILRESHTLNLDIRSTDRFKRTPLTWAIYHQNLAMVKLLVAAGATINFYDKDGFGPLYYALEHYNRPILFYLIEQGADINHIPAYAERGEVLLYEVAFRGDVELLKLLYAKGGNLHYEYDLWGSPLDAALESNHLEVARWLIEKGTDMEILFDEGRNVLMVAIEEGYTEGALLLLELGANPNAISEFGWTPLCFAAKVGNIAVAQTLLNKGADINFTIPKKLNEEEYGYFPLLLTISYHQIPMLQFLIGQGADIHLTDVGKPIILSTIENKELAATKILIAAGANIFAISDKQETALFLICGIINDCEKALKKAKSPNASEWDKIRVKRLSTNQTLELAFELLSTLLEKGCKAHTIAIYSHTNEVTALELLLESENLWAIETLLKHGAKSIYYEHSRRQIDLQEKLNIQNPNLLNLLEKRDKLAFEHLQLSPEIQPILKQWDALAKNNYFPYANYHDYFRLYRIRLTAYVCGKKWKLIFQQLGGRYSGAARFYNWIGVLTEQSTNHTDWYPINDLTTSQNFREYYIDDYGTAASYQKEASRYGEKIPDNGQDWARTQQFKVQLNQEEYTLQPRWEDYQAAGVAMKKAYYKQNNTVNEYDLFEVAMHLLADKMWVTNPIEQLNLATKEEVWLPVFEDEGASILAHVFNLDKPSASPYWQKVAQCITR